MSKSSFWTAQIKIKLPHKRPEVKNGLFSCKNSMTGLYLGSTERIEGS